MHKRLLSYFATFALLGVAALVWFNQQAIFDAWRLRDYTPPAAVVKIADDTTMTDKTRRLFYVYRPSLDDKAAFNQNCTSAEQTIVLGCYIENKGIYLYKISDQRLSGIIEVTAAHEVLHAAYDRLSDAERQRIDTLTAQVESTLTDERLLSTIESYRSRDPSVVPNELHSILATELQDLPDELESYYAQYFKDRKAVVRFADTYKQAFTERENQVKAIDAQLESIKAQIDSLNQSLEMQQGELKAQFDDLQNKRQGGSAQEYNAAVPAYNQAVVRYNSDVNRQKQLVTQYNGLVEQRNTLATEENELIDAIDSRSTFEEQ